jgi:hypothetical protein
MAASPRSDAAAMPVAQSRRAFAASVVFLYSVEIKRKNRKEETA